MSASDPQSGSKVPALSPPASARLFDRFFNALIEMAFLPEADWPALVETFSPNPLGGFGGKRIAKETFAWIHPQLLAIHYRLARSVQPTGESLDPLAATIGAVRLKDPRHARVASEHLGRLVIKAFQDGDQSTLDRIAGLSSAPLAEHRNFNVWLVIDELIQSRIGTPQESLPITKADAKRHVSANQSRFVDLAELENKGWNRMWQLSGAVLVSTRGGRGKDTRPRRRRQGSEE